MPYEKYTDNLDNQKDIVHPYKDNLNNQSDNLDTLTRYWNTQTDGHLDGQSNGLHGDKDNTTWPTAQADR